MSKPKQKPVTGDVVARYTTPEGQDIMSVAISLPVSEWEELTDWMVGFLSKVDAAGKPIDGLDERIEALAYLLLLDLKKTIKTAFDIPITNVDGSPFLR